MIDGKYVFQHSELKLILNPVFPTALCTYEVLTSAIL